MVGGNHNALDITKIMPALYSQMVYKLSKQKQRWSCQEISDKKTSQAEKKAPIHNILQFFHYNLEHLPTLPVISSSINLIEHATPTQYYGK